MIPFLVAFLIPVFIILIFNVIIYVIIIRVVILHTIRKNKRMNKSLLTTSEAIKMILSYSGILILFGLTWLFGVFTFIVEPNVSFIVQFFFAFFNAFQGFFIFFFFVIINSDSRDAWKSLLCPWTVKNGKKPRTSSTAKDKTSSIKFAASQESGPKNETLTNTKENKQKGFVNNLIFENETILEDKSFPIEDVIFPHDANTM